MLVLSIRHGGHENGSNTCDANRSSTPPICTLQRAHADADNPFVVHGSLDETVFPGDPAISSFIGAGRPNAGRYSSYRRLTAVQFSSAL